MARSVRCVAVTSTDQRRPTSFSTADQFTLSDQRRFLLCFARLDRSRSFSTAPPEERHPPAPLSSHPGTKSPPAPLRYQRGAGSPAPFSFSFTASHRLPRTAGQPPPPAPGSRSPDLRKRKALRRGGPVPPSAAVGRAGARGWRPRGEGRPPWRREDLSREGNGGGTVAGGTGAGQSAGLASTRLSVGRSPAPRQQGLRLAGSALTQQGRQLAAPGFFLIRPMKKRLIKWTAQVKFSQIHNVKLHQQDCTE